MKQEGGTTQRLPCKCSHAPAHLSDLFSVLHPAKKTHDLHFQRQNLGVCVGAIKGDIKGGFHFSHVLVAEDMDFHLFTAGSQGLEECLGYVNIYRMNSLKCFFP